MRITLSILIIWCASAAYAGDTPPRTIYDATGRRVGTVEPNPIIPDQYVVKDTQGRRTGTVEPNPVIKGEWVVKDAQGKRTGSVR